MKAAHLLCFISMLTSTSGAAESSVLVDQAKKAAAGLPRGCIVTAEQTANGVPDIAIAGKHEPRDVPSEKIIFEIGSISKVFTGLLLAQAVIEKKLTLDSTLRELMGPTQTFADENVARITLLQLATHTSGLPRMPEDYQPDFASGDPYAHYERKHLNATVAKAKLAHAAPFPFSYSNLGVGLLGDLLARLYGKPWEQLVLERITKPLAMKDTCITLNAEQQKRAAPPYAGDKPAKPIHLIALAGAGALHSTTMDMLAFGRALARPEASPLKEAIQLIEQPRDDGKTGLCLGISSIQGRPAYWFQGGTNGFASWISARSSDAHVVSILINNSALLPQTLLSGKAPVAAAPASPPAPEDASLADYVGVYDTGFESPRGHIYYTFEGRDHELWHQITGQPFRQLTRHPTTADRFEMKSFNAEIQFNRENGKVVSTTLFQSGLEIKASKSPKP